MPAHTTSVVHILKNLQPHAILLRHPVVDAVNGPVLPPLSVYLPPLVDKVAPEFLPQLGLRLWGVRAGLLPGSVWDTLRPF